MANPAAAQLDMSFTTTVASGNAVPHRRGNQPSLAGARRAQPKSTGQRTVALAFIHRKGGCTIHELAVAMGLVDGTASRIIRQLVLGGHVIDSGRTRTNAHSGLNVTLWVPVR